MSTFYEKEAVRLEGQNRKLILENARLRSELERQRRYMAETTPGPISEAKFRELYIGEWKPEGGEL